jgi:hypothetical protein
MPTSVPRSPKIEATNEIDTAKTIPGMRKGKLILPTRKRLNFEFRRQASAATRTANAIANIEETQAITTLLTKAPVQLGSEKKA